MTRVVGDSRKPHAHFLQMKRERFPAASLRERLWSCSVELRFNELMVIVLFTVNRGAICRPPVRGSLGSGSGSGVGCCFVVQ